MLSQVVYVRSRLHPINKIYGPDENRPASVTIASGLFVCLFSVKAEALSGQSVNKAVVIQVNKVKPVVQCKCINAV